MCVYSPKINEISISTSLTALHIMRMYKLFSLFLFIGASIVSQHGAHIPVEEFDMAIFTNEIKTWITDGVMSEKLIKILDHLAIPTQLERLDKASLNNVQASTLCAICKSLTKTIILLTQAETPTESIEDSTIKLCTFLNLSTETVCRGIITLNMPIILHIIKNDRTINEDDVCGLVLQEQSCGNSKGRYEWSIDIDSSPPRKLNIKPSEESLQILQITDIHYDPLYEPGGNSGCREPTCCRRGQNITGGNNKQAGYWGDFHNCDSPWHSVVDALNHMHKQHKNIDLIYFTGDIIDHGVWETSRESNADSLTKSFNKIKETFGDRAVYPILGNHEPHPLNLFAPNDIEEDSLSTRWLYQLLADAWINNNWLPESTRETILRGGFYTVSPKKGFRVIAINNNVCYVYNWWLIYKPNDPSGQLQWLASTLLAAEENEEFVHILGHVPAGSDECQHTWDREYRRIINRFSHIITAQFNGHTHNDEFNVFYDLNDTTKMINIAWNGGSITPYAYLNPNYKVYLADAKTYAIEDAETWMYNLTKANETPEKRPHWFKSYSFKDEYGLVDLSTDSLNQMIFGMAKGGPILEKYHRNFFKHAAPESEKPCDESCRRSYICRIVISSSGDKNNCEYLQTIR